MNSRETYEYKNYEKDLSVLTDKSMSVFQLDGYMLTRECPAVVAERQRLDKANLVWQSLLMFDNFSGDNI